MHLKYILWTKHDLGDLIKNKFVAGTIALIATALLMSGCSILGGDNDDLSDACKNAVDEAGSNFVSLLEEAVNGNSRLENLESAVDNAKEVCKGEDPDLVLSGIIVSVSKKANSVSPDAAKSIVYVGLNSLCDQMREEKEFFPTEEAKQACVEAAGKIADSSPGSNDGPETTAPPSSGSSDSIFGEDGPAIGDVDTDLTFPGDTSPSDAPYNTGTVPEYERTYIVDGVGTATISYIDANDNYQYGTVSLPWQYTAKSTYDYLSVSATGNSEGQLSCAVYADSVQQDFYSDSGPAPSISCFAFID